MIEVMYLQQGYDDPGGATPDGYGADGSGRRPGVALHPAGEENVRGTIAEQMVQPHRGNDIERIWKMNNKINERYLIIKTR